jgi:phospholipase/carboxylesterase
VTCPSHRTPSNGSSTISRGRRDRIVAHPTGRSLFTHIIAFSPGFLVATPRTGTSRVYISHGRADTVLPINRTTRCIVPRLQAAGIPTDVHEFDGPHVVPADIAADAVRWLTSD